MNSTCQSRYYGPVSVVFIQGLWERVTVGKFRHFLNIEVCQHTLWVAKFPQTFSYCFQSFYWYILVKTHWLFTKNICILLYVNNTAMKVIKNKRKQNKTYQDLGENVPYLQGSRLEMKQCPFNLGDSWDYLDYFKGIEFPIRKKSPMFYYLGFFSASSFKTVKF